MIHRKTFSFLVVGIALLVSEISDGHVPGDDAAALPGLTALPSPTGPFSVGKVVVHLRDESRIEPLSPTHEPRELMVDIWYPSESQKTAAAQYLDVAAYQQELGVDGFQKYFGNASETITKGVQTHAVLGAPYAQLAKWSPVLIFSPGGGMVREVYSAQLEDLASHGYVVAAISHPYDAIVTVFPDGRAISYSDKRWPAIPSLEGEANLNQVEWHANDIRFVLDELTRDNPAPSSALPFAGHLDLDRVGAFGHSFGGVAAAHACQLDRRFKACLNEDGLIAEKPFYLDVRGWGMDQAFMLIVRYAPRPRLSDDELAKMKMTRQRVEQIAARLDEYQERALRSTGKGSYRVRLRNEMTSHMDFSDLPILAARDASEEAKRTSILAVVRSYTLAFFSQALEGKESDLLNKPAATEFFEAVQRFGPASLPCATQ